MEANKNRQEYGQLRELYGLSAEMAGRLMHFAQKNGIPAVMEKQAENSFSVFTPADKAIREKVDRLFFAAAWDVSGLSGQAEKPRSAYAAQERFEIMHALERTGEKMTDAYVFSASQPGNLHPTSKNLDSLSMMAAKQSWWQENRMILKITKNR